MEAFYHRVCSFWPTIVLSEWRGLSTSATEDPADINHCIVCFHYVNQYRPEARRLIFSSGQVCVYMFFFSVKCWDSVYLVQLVKRGACRKLQVHSFKLAWHATFWGGKFFSLTPWVEARRIPIPSMNGTVIRKICLLYTSPSPRD